MILTICALAFARFSTTIDRVCWKDARGVMDEITITEIGDLHDQAYQDESWVCTLIWPDRLNVCTNGVGYVPVGVGEDGELHPVLSIDPSER